MAGLGSGHPGFLVHQMALAKPQSMEQVPQEMGQGSWAGEGRGLGQEDGSKLPHLPCFGQVPPVCSLDSFFRSVDQAGCCCRVTQSHLDECEVWLNVFILEGRAGGGTVCGLHGYQGGPASAPFLRVSHRSLWWYWPHSNKLAGQWGTQRKSQALEPDDLSSRPTGLDHRAILRLNSMASG